MYSRLLTFLRCPDCGGDLRLETLAHDRTDPDDTSEGLLHCRADHWYPVVGGIPRMLPGALAQHWRRLEPLLPASTPDAVVAAAARAGCTGLSGTYDRRTQENFTLEWEQHEVGDRTWGMSLDDRVRWFFVEPLRVAPEAMQEQIVLDAGCGNGSQSVAYTTLGLEVIALDLSSGLERGHAFRRSLPGAGPDRVHFVQADLQRPPLAPATVDIIHSAGVLHHTPDTGRTFHRLCPLLKPEGTFYVWFYKYERFVTPVVNTMRLVTTRLHADTFAKLARSFSVPFIAFCHILDRAGLRGYADMTRREATLALMDIFGAPYAHYHSYEEVVEWYRAEGFTETWPCNDDRRGFGVCGRRTVDPGHREPSALEPDLTTAP